MPDGRSRLDSPEKRLTELLSISLEAARESLARLRAHHELAAGSVVKIVRDHFTPENPAATPEDYSRVPPTVWGLARATGLSRPAALAVGVEVVAARSKLDPGRLLYITHLTLAAREALRETGYVAPVFRATPDQPEGAWTAATSEAVPRRERLEKLADKLEKAAEALTDATTDPTMWVPLEHVARTMSELSLPYEERDCSPAERESPWLEMHNVAAALDMVAQWARSAVREGSKPRPSAAAGWRGWGIGLLARLWEESRGPLQREDYEWETAARSWLRLLEGDGRGTSMLLRDPSRDDGRFDELLDTAGVRRTPPFPPLDLLLAEEDG